MYCIYIVYSYCICVMYLCCVFVLYLYCVLCICFVYLHCVLSCVIVLHLCRVFVLCIVRHAVVPQLLRLRTLKTSEHFHDHHVIFLSVSFSWFRYFVLLLMSSVCFWHHQALKPPVSQSDVFLLCSFFGGNPPVDDHFLLRDNIFNLFPQLFDETLLTH